MRLAAVRAVVTGAARGLGRHFALAIAAGGGAAVAGDVDRAALRELKAAGSGLAGSLTVAGVDVADEASVVAFVAGAAAAAPGLNVLINNAGILRDGLLVTGSGEEFHKLPALQWRKVLDVNLTGQFLVAREFAARVLESGVRDAVIVNISSLARTGNAGQSSYSSSKAGLDACTRSWALELAPRGIRVGGVAPGVIDTPMLRGIADDALAKLVAGIPLGRKGTPEEVWQAVRFVIECDFFTGRTLEIDGGAGMGI